MNSYRAITLFSLFIRIEDNSNQGVESSIASPPSSPPSKSSQGEERRSNSSEPNSPQPDDSFSDRGEQQLEDDRGVFLPPGGGQLYTECAPRENGRERKRERKRERERGRRGRG